jgi:hypothetical protein
MSNFVVYDTKQDNEGASTAHLLAEPVLVSFPANIPTEDNMQKMKFNIYQLPKNGKPNTNKNKRVVKSERKNIEYTANNFSKGVAESNQGSDYYLGVMSAKHEDKVYMVPVRTRYQF